MSDTHAAIAEFVAAAAAAWAAADADWLAEAMGLPQMIAGGDGTTFIEDDAALEAWIDARLDRWADHGVAAATAVVEQVEDLPDDAARVTTRWHLADAGGAPVTSFVAVDTLVCDDGEWYYVVTDTAGEDAGTAAN